MTSSNKLMFMEAKASKALEVVFRAQERKQARGRKPEVAQHRSGVSLGSDFYCKFVSKKQNRTSAGRRTEAADPPEIRLEYKKSSVSPDRLSAQEFPAKRLELLSRASAPASPLVKSRPEPRRIHLGVHESNSNWFSPAGDPRVDSPAIDQSRDSSPTLARTQSSAWGLGAGFFPAPVSVSDFAQKLAGDPEAAHAPQSGKKSPAPYIHLFRKNVYRAQANSPADSQLPQQRLPFPRSSLAAAHDSADLAPRLGSRSPSARLFRGEIQAKSQAGLDCSESRLADAFAGPRDSWQPAPCSKSLVRKRMSVSLSNNIVSSKNGKQSKKNQLQAIVHRADSFL